MRSPTAVWIFKRKGKRGTTYRLRWISPRTGSWESEACGRDMAFARLRREQIRQELREGLSGKTPHTPLAELTDRLGTPMAGRSEQTIERTRDSLTQLGKLCRVCDIAGIDRGMIMSFRAKRLAGGAAPATVNKDLRQLRSAFSYAVDAGLLRGNPLLRWKGLMIPEPEKQVRVIEQAEFEKLMAACKNTSFRAMLTVGYRQGLRRGELLNLRWSALDLGKRALLVLNMREEGELTKSRKNRAMPMHLDVHAVLADLWKQAPKKLDVQGIWASNPHVFTWPDGRPFCPDWASHEFERLVKKVGIPHCTMHDLRRSFSTIAQRAGVDKAVVKDLGGWSCMSVVEKHYTGDVSDVHRKAMEKIAASA